MSNIYSSVRTAVRNVAVKALDEYPTTPIIFSHQNGAEPEESYVIINILDEQQIGHHSTSSFTEDGTELLTYQTAYEIQVQFSFCGSLSGDLAYTFNNRINNSPWVIEEIARQNLGLMRKSNVRRAPQKRETRWVEFHNMTVTFNYILVTQEIVDVVEHILLSDDLSGIEITIPPYEASQLITEDGNQITTESGDILTTES